MINDSSFRLKVLITSTLDMAEVITLVLINLRSESDSGSLIINFKIAELSR